LTKEAANMKLKKMGAFVALMLIVVAAVIGCGCDDDDDDAGDDDDDDNNDNASPDDDDDNDTPFEVTEGFEHILAGTFTMGTGIDYGCYHHEALHEVTLTRDFEIMATEVTQQRFEDAMGFNPSSFADCGGDCPVEQVTWFDALALANRASEQAGKPPCYMLSDLMCGLEEVTDDAYCLAHGYIREATVALNGVASVYACEGYRLPTEAEWEYSVRAGTTTDFYGGDGFYNDCYSTNASLDPYAWYCGNSDEMTHPAAQKLPNPWGLFDSSGNVEEWVWDGWDGSDYPSTSQTDPGGAVPSAERRVVRGGHFDREPCDCRSASRSGAAMATFRAKEGIRLVRTLGAD
jgi:formylglycine-generating enzyme required for sulfatase activity